MEYDENNTAMFAAIPPERAAVYASTPDASPPKSYKEAIERSKERSMSKVLREKKWTPDELKAWAVSLWGDESVTLREVAEAALAFIGDTVPPLRRGGVPCTACGGDGYREGSGYPCATCNATGEVSAT